MSPTCSACGDPFDTVDAVTVDGLSFHDLCYAMERYGNPWHEDIESLAEIPDASGVVRGDRGAGA